MLLIYHFDTKSDTTRRITNRVLRLELGFFPKPTQRIILKMIGFAHDRTGSTMYFRFPDVRERFIEEEDVDAVDEWELPGLAVDAQFGQNASLGRGEHATASTTEAFDLDLGFMDPQKDFFSVIVNSRFGTVFEDNVQDNANNISLVFEVHDVTAST